MAALASIPYRNVNAATILLQPVADTTLTEYAPNNNLGGTTFVTAGTTGVNAGGARTRGLYRFDFSSIPANSKITSVSFTLEVTWEPGNPESSSFALHRMLRSWGEGNKDSTSEQSPGLGLSATEGEATWNSPFALTTNAWNTPGAANDFSPVVSSRTHVYGLADFPVFASTPELIADVQTWFDDPAANFGWLLKTESEDLFFTARRFGSREFTAGDPNSPPVLEIEFLPAPTIFDHEISDGNFSFKFLAEANQDYKVQFRNEIGTTNSWLTLTNFQALAESTKVVVSESVSTSARFYRVVVP